MTREDMIDLIMVSEAIDRLNIQINEFTGGAAIENPYLEKLDAVVDIIRRNSRYSGEDDPDVDNFDAIIHAVNISAEEKYELLKL